MSNVKEMEETGQDLPSGLENKQLDELGQGEQHDSPEPMEGKIDASEHLDLDSKPEVNPSSNEHLTPDSETVGAASDNKNVVLLSNHEEPHQASVKPDVEPTLDVKLEEDQERDQSKTSCENEATVSASNTEADVPASKNPKTEACEFPKKSHTVSATHIKARDTLHDASSDGKAEIENGDELKKGVNSTPNPAPINNGNSNSKHSFLLDDDKMYYEGSESGTKEDQSAFMMELENFFKERNMEFKPPKFYGEGLNCLKLWRAVTKLGGYDKVTSFKLWRQVGESFRPPKTCTTVSWTFRGFYEKALLDYERHKTRGGELIFPDISHVEPISVENQASGSGRARRDAASRAMQGWHSRLLGNGEVSDPIIKDKNSIALQKCDKHLKSVGLLKRKKLPYIENPVKAARTETSKPQVDTAVVDIGTPADWVKINVQRSKDCYEVYALVPGLLRDEVHVESDAAGRVVISGEPEHPDNPWGVTPFKKVVRLPSRIDPHQTSAVVTLHGQLFIRVPFEQSE